MTEIRMPHMGVSVTEGTVTAWHVRPGDAVRAGQVVCDVATDKVEVEVEAEADGVVAELLSAEGDTVPVGAALARLAGDAEPEPEPSAAFDPVAAADAVLARRGRRAGPAVSPVARRLAAHHGVELTAVAGSGRHGRVRKADVLAAIASPAPAGNGGAPLPPGYEDVPYEIVRTPHVRRVIAEHMVRSRQTAAHMTTEVYVDMTTVAAVRAEVNAVRERRGAGRLSYLPFIVHAACGALRSFPELNATFELERSIRWRDMNIGIAVDTPDGLRVPVIRRCQELTAEAIGERIADLARATREGTASPEAFRGGTFTVSNPGSVGAASAPAIINQPQVAILGLPAVIRRPWVVALADGTESIAIRPIMKLALTFDHRAVDGADATRAAVAIRGALESWRVGDYS